MNKDTKDTLAQAQKRPSEKQQHQTGQVKAGGQPAAGRTAQHGKQGGGDKSKRPGGSGDRKGGGQSGQGKGGPRGEVAPRYKCEIHAPYNFVPLARTIWHPDWQAAVSHDLPFEDGLCGEIELTAIADTPILVGSEKPENAPVQFFRHPDGTYAIPGSALRGMLRNVLEIATFSRMGTYVDDQHLAVRDLTSGLSEIYRKEFAKTLGSKFHSEVGRKVSIYGSKVKSGWLEFERGKWQLYPCVHSRIEQTDLKNLVREYGNNQLSLRGKSFDKYEAYMTGIGRRSLSVNYETTELAEHKHNKKFMQYRKVTTIGSGREQGWLVFTGQPGPGKHMEFVFSAPRSAPVLIEPVVSGEFMNIHTSKEKGEKSELDWLRNNSGLFPCGIPVFYLTEGQRIKAIGLAQMFKLAYRNSLHDALSVSSPLHSGGDAQMDFVETLFGRVDARNPADALKGRVSFGDARATSKDVKPMATITTILSSPKPTYYPNYIVQTKTGPDGHLPTERDDRNRECGQKPKVGYSTLMDDTPELRGWKRYPVRPEGQVKPQPLYVQQATNRKIQTQLQPLPAKTAFVGKLRFHNLKAEELGALVWALTWGGDARYRHAIGMGKPFGYGSLRIELVKAQLIPNRPDAPQPTLEACRHAFADWAKASHTAAGGTGEWSECEQLRHLLTMADPAQAKGKKLEHMVLDGETNNHFLGAKKAGRVLPPYIKS